MNIKKFILIIIPAFVAMILITAIVLIAKISDSSDVRSEAVIADTVSFESRMSDKLVESLSDTSDTGEINLTFTEEQFNLFMGAAIRKLGNSLIRGASAEIADLNSLSVALGVSLPGMNSVIRADILYTETADNMVFSLLNIKLGKLKLSPGIAKIIINKFNNNLFSFTLSTEDDLLLISISKTELANYLSSLTDEDENLELYRVALKRCLKEEGMLSVKFGTDEEIGADVNLSKLVYNEVRDGEAYSDITIADLNSKLALLLNNGALNQETLNTGAKFILMGYQKLSNEEQDVIDNINFSSVGIVNNRYYDGIINYDERTLSSIVVEHLPMVLPLQGEVFFKVTEDDLNMLVLQSDVIGSVTSYARQTEGGYEVSSIVLESFNADIEDDSIILKFIMSINGKKLIFSAEMHSQPTSITSITLSLGEVRMGSLIATEEEKEAIFGMIDSVFEAQDWIICDQEAKTVTFDFKDSINGNFLLRTAFSSIGGLITTSMVDDGGEGYIKVGVELF